VKHGEGEEWSTSKVGQPRYFCYWSAETISPVLHAAGFDLIATFRDAKFLCLIARCKNSNAV